MTNTIKNKVKQNMKTYGNIVHDWVYNKRKFVDNADLLVEFFKNGFEYTTIPEKVYFGTSKSAISFIMGGLYLMACTTTQGIWILQDTIHKELDNYFVQKIVGSTKNHTPNLYWLNFEDIGTLESINTNLNVWKSYEKASSIVNNTQHGKFTRQDFIKDKSPLTCFWKYGDNTLKKLENINGKTENEINIAKQRSNTERQKRLKAAPKIPTKTNLTIENYSRNPDVVEESLYRADGICEICNCVAPFIKIKDNTPYLEVHHIIPFSQGGEDTIENTKALCPNCHRKQHYGI